METRPLIAAFDESSTYSYGVENERVVAWRGRIAPIFEPWILG